MDDLEGKLRELRKAVVCGECEESHCDHLGDMDVVLREAAALGRAEGLERDMWFRVQDRHLPELTKMHMDGKHVIRESEPVLTYDEDECVYRVATLGQYDEGTISFSEIGGDMLDPTHWGPLPKFKAWIPKEEA